MTFQIRFKAPGPVAQAFMQCDKRQKMIMGPWRSGKTTCCFVDLLSRACKQAPSHVDGIRHSKWVIVRDTYRNLAKTTIPTWHRWVPKELGEWSGEPPYSHRFQFELERGDIVDIWVEFYALAGERAETVMRGYETTGAYLNEADILTEEDLIYVRGRCGQYPPRAEADITWYGVLLDMNAPNTDNWTHRVFIEEPGVEHAFFRQPSALSPEAENLDNLVPNYYEELAQDKPDWFVRRMIRNEFGFSRHGMPVYPEWSDRRHVADRILKPVEGIGLIIGLDAGLTPAGVILQHLPNGQWRCYAEIVTANDRKMGPVRFGQALSQILAERFADFTELSVWSDPSSQYGADVEGGEQSWIEIVSPDVGIRIRPAPTNEIIPRLEAVRQPLARPIDGETPGFLLSPDCPTLRRGFNSGYQFRRTPVAGRDRYEDKPEKNEYSNPHDALQYGMLGGGEYFQVLGRRKRRQHMQPSSAILVDPGA